jgi:hypothetical protein
VHQRSATVDFNGGNQSSNGGLLLLRQAERTAGVCWRLDPLMKLMVGRCPESGAALASQSTICRLENAPCKSEAARLCAALIDQFGTTVKPGRLEILDIDDTFCAAHGSQQLAFWNAHHDERGFASMHIYHVASGTPIVILRPARTPKGTEVRPSSST